MYKDHNYEMVRLIGELPPSVPGAHKHEHVWYSLPALCFEQMCIWKAQKILVPIVHSSVSDKDDLVGAYILGAQIRTEEEHATVCIHHASNRRV